MSLHRNEWPEAVFTRTTLFTTMFTIIVVHSLSIPSYVLIGCCLSEIHAHLCPYIVIYGLRLCYTRITLFAELFTYLYDQS